MAVSIFVAIFVAQPRPARALHPMHSNRLSAFVAAFGRGGCGGEVVAFIFETHVWFNGVATTRWWIHPVRVRVRVRVRARARVRLRLRVRVRVKVRVKGEEGRG